MRMFNLSWVSWKMLDRICKTLLTLIRCTKDSVLTYWVCRLVQVCLLLQTLIRKVNYLLRLRLYVKGLLTNLVISYQISVLWTHLHLKLTSIWFLYVVTLLPRVMFIRVNIWLINGMLLEKMFLMMRLSLLTLLIKHRHTGLTVKMLKRTRMLLQLMLPMFLLHTCKSA